MAAAAPFAASALGGIFSGIGAGKPKTSTSTSESKGTQEAVLTGKQNKVMKTMFQQILSALKLGPQVSQSDRNLARGQINKTYDSANENLLSNLSARGFGDSGKAGVGLEDNGFERAKGIQNSEAILRDQSQNRFQQMIQNAFAFMQPRTFNTTQSSTQTGSQSGTPWQSSLGGGIGDLSSLLYLRNMGSPGSGGGSSLPSYGNNFFDMAKSVPSFGYPSCNVARELYGERDIRVLIVMSWLAAQARRSFAWNIVVQVYRLTGRHLARLVRWSKTARRLASFGFDRIVAQAMNV